MRTILVTGFGPFPGAPVNPTGPLVRALVRSARIAGIKIVGHVFETSYAAVDRDLPRLVARYEPDILLMFGLATRARWLRVETLARNAMSGLPDARGHRPQRRDIVTGAPTTWPLPTPARHLVNALCAAGFPVMRSRNAGDYLCNYLCWRVADAATAAKGPRIAAFIHLLPARRGGRFDSAALANATKVLLATVVAAARR